MPQHTLVSLNTAENAQVNCNKLLSLTAMMAEHFEVFKWTAGCIFKCETTKIKLAKKHRKFIFKQQDFCM